jgi:hypothetical protein
MVRGGVVAAGVILMIIGAILFFAYPITPNNQGANPFGDLFIGPVLGFIGFILLIAGLAASPTPPPTVVYQTPPPSARAEPNNPNEWIQWRMAREMGQEYNPPTRGSQTTSGAAPPPPDNQPSPTPMARMQSPANESNGGFCPFCGKGMRPGYRFCRSCGKELPADE